MSKDEDGGKGQTFIPKNQSYNQSLVKVEGKDLSKKNEENQKLGWMDALNNSQYGIRNRTRKAIAYRDMCEAMRLAAEELEKLDDTPARMKKERLIQEDEFKNRKKDIAVKGLQLDLDNNRLLRQIQKEQDAKELLDLKKRLKQSELELQIAELKNKMDRLDGSTHDMPSPADPQLEQVRDDMKRYMERHRHLGNDKKQWFAQIDADLARGELSEEMAENMKEDIEQIIRDTLLKP